MAPLFSTFRVNDVCRNVKDRVKVQSKKFEIAGQPMISCRYGEIEEGERGAP